MLKWAQILKHKSYTWNCHICINLPITIPCPESSQAIPLSVLPNLKHLVTSLLLIVVSIAHFIIQILSRWKKHFIIIIIQMSLTVGARGPQFENHRQLITASLARSPLTTSCKQLQTTANNRDNCLTFFYIPTATHNNRKQPRQQLTISQT